MSKNYSIKLHVFVVSFIVAFIVKRLYMYLGWTFLAYMQKLLTILWVSCATTTLMQIVIDLKLYKGFRYAFTYYRVKETLTKQLIDAGIYMDRGDYIELPQIKLSFNRTLSEGTLMIKNSVSFHHKLNEVNLSAALHNYIIETHFLTDNQNFHVFTIVNSEMDFKLSFESFREYELYCRKISQYSIFLDRRSTVKLQSMLLVGVTGGGKTYFTYNLLLQFYTKVIPYELYYADPKGSSLAVIGQIVSPNRTATEFENIIKLLEEFVEKMQLRKEEIKELLKSRIDADYSDFGKSPYILVFDEYATFSAVLAGKEKKIRDRVNDTLMEIVLQGRQLGFFIICIMQKSGADLINTSLRDNLPLKIVLGNSGQQTYLTAFGTGVHIPERHYGVGEGVFTEPKVALQPKVVYCTYLKFDILDAIKTANSRDVITGVAEYKSD